MNYDLIKSDRLISSFLRTTQSQDVEISDLYEWIGESMGFLNVPGVIEQRLIFMEVKDFHCYLPKGFKGLLQVAKDNCPEETLCSTTTTTEIKEEETPTVLLDCEGNPLCPIDEVFFSPSPCYNPFPITYNQWLNSVSYSHLNRFTPIRLSNHTLFKSSVCKELNWDEIYQSSQWEYAIVNNKSQVRKMRFNFQTGVVAMSYLRDSNTDCEPLVPDNQVFLTAINYYLLWKYSESQMFKGIQGAISLNDRAEAKWLKYCKQAKNEAMMPDLAMMDNIMQNTFKILPSLKVFKNMFSDLSAEVSTSYILNGNMNS